MADAKPPRRPLTDDELDELALITPDDIDRAEQWWNDHCSPHMRGLLSAKLEQPSERKPRRAG